MPRFFLAIRLYSARRKGLPQCQAEREKCSPAIGGFPGVFPENRPLAHRTQTRVSRSLAMGCCSFGNEFPVESRFGTDKFSTFAPRRPIPFQTGFSLTSAPIAPRFALKAKTFRFEYGAFPLQIDSSASIARIGSRVTPTEKPNEHRATVHGFASGVALRPPRSGCMERVPPLIGFAGRGVFSVCDFGSWESS